MEDPNESPALTPTDVEGMVRAAADAYGIDPDHLVKLAHQESGLNPNVPSSKKGAIGVMQLMPGTAKDLGVDPKDTLQNIEGGARYFRGLLDRFGGDYGKATAAYNAGPEAVAQNRPLPQETQDYLAAIGTPKPRGKFSLNDISQPAQPQGHGAFSLSDVSQPEAAPASGPQSLTPPPPPKPTGVPIEPVWTPQRAAMQAAVDTVHALSPSTVKQLAKQTGENAMRVVGALGELGAAGFGPGGTPIAPPKEQQPQFQEKVGQAADVLRGVPLLPISELAPEHGFVHGLYKGAEGFTSPFNVALAVAIPGLGGAVAEAPGMAAAVTRDFASLGLNAYFQVGLWKGAGEAGQKAWEAYQKGDTTGAAEQLGEGLTSAIMAGLATKEAADRITDLKDAYGIQFGKPETGVVGQGSFGGGKPGERPPAAGTQPGATPPPSGTPPPAGTPPPPPEAAPSGEANAPEGPPEAGTPDRSNQELVRGNVFDTPQGKFTVRAVTSKQVLFEREDSQGKRAGSMPIDDFRNLVFAPPPPSQNPQQPPVPAPQPAEPTPSTTAPPSQIAAPEPQSAPGVPSPIGGLIPPMPPIFGPRLGLQPITPELATAAPPQPGFRPLGPQPVAPPAGAPSQPPIAPITSAPAPNLPQPGMPAPAAPEEKIEQQPAFRDGDEVEIWNPSKGGWVRTQIAQVKPGLGVADLYDPSNPRNILRDVKLDSLRPIQNASPAGAPGLIDAVYDKLKSGGSLGNSTEFMKLAEQHFGSSRTSGQWTPKDAFDAMEAGINKYLIDRGGELMSMPYEQAMQELRGLMDRITSQGIRTEDQVKNQQFSTPPTESFTVAKAAGVRPDDVVLEPSAGNGGLVVWPKAIGAQVHVNEISDRRRAMLEAIGFTGATAHDGEILNSLLDRDVKPTVVLMNPPFSAGTVKSNEAKNKNLYGFNHVDAALQRLQPGGRLVAILGGGRADDSNGGASLNTGPSGKWFERVAKQYHIRANIRVHGKEYQKYGTSFATRIIVIDKTGPTPSQSTPGQVKTWDSVIQGNVDTLEEAYNLLRDVAADRPGSELSPRPAGGVRSGQGNAPTGVGAGAGAGGPVPGGVLPGGGGTPATNGPAGGPAEPSGGPGNNQPGAGNQQPGLQQPGSEPESPAGPTPAGSAAGGAENAPEQRPLEQPQTLGGLTPEQIAAAAAKALAQKLGLPIPERAPAPTPAPAPPSRAPRKAPAAPAPPKPETRIRNAASDAADAARQRLKAKLSQQQKPAGLQSRADEIQQDVIDLATIGAEHMLNGATGFDDWSNKLQSDVGDLVNLVAQETGTPAADLLKQVFAIAQAVSAQLGPKPLQGDETTSGTITLEREEYAGPPTEDTDAYVTYRPTIKGAAHPGEIVETKTMATVPLPAITYRPHLPEWATKRGISAVQMEAVAIAGQQNAITLPNGAYASALIGDGTGVGKGRIAASILWDNYRQGRKRLVWVSEKWDLMQDAIRDLYGIDAKELLRMVERGVTGQYVTPTNAAVQPFKKFASGTKIDHDGVLFSTYALIRSENNKGDRRVAQLEEYLRGNDDGEGAYILFDEAHNLKNAVANQGGQTSQIGRAVKELLERMPKLRTVSLSATAATDVVNLGYLDRLGLWGPGTPFPNGFNEFQSQIAPGGMAAMEMIARELKAQGKYLSRTLSFKGVSYDEAEHNLTDDQKELYRTASRAWSSVLENAEASIQQTTNGGGRQLGRFMAQFYGAQQRFFNLLITTLKIPKCIELANEALANDKSVVITLVNTNEAAQNREKNKAKDLDDSDEPPDFDFGPKEMLMQLVKDHFPVQQYRDDVDSAGNPIKVPVYRKDKDGREIPVNNPAAEAARDALVQQLDRDLNMPENPLDILIQSLGGDKKVAELTGRKEKFDRNTGKFVPRGDPNAKRDQINLFEMAAFQSGKKRVAILSNAAGTGISLHAGNDVANKQKRYHITLQVGWSADKAMQMFGRTHRTNEAHPPEYVMLVSDLGGERRFVATIARRLGSLGALTKGQKNAASGTDLMEKVNFETDQGKQATNSFYQSLLMDRPVPGTGLTGLQILTDLHVLKTQGGTLTVPQADRTNVTRLLNRLLALDPDIQNAVYNYFYDIFQASVQDAIDNGTLDTGVKTLPGDEFEVKESRPISKDPNTGAETYYYQVDAKIRTKRLSPEDLEKRLKSNRDANARILRNDKGDVILATDARPIVHSDGRTEPASYVYKPSRGEPVKMANADFHRYTEVSDWAKKRAAELQAKIDRQQGDVNWYADYYSAEHPTTKAKQAELTNLQQELGEVNAATDNPEQWARDRWKELYEASPSHITESHHLIGGAVMRWWNPIKDSTFVRNSIFTTSDSKTGQRVVGIDIPGDRIRDLLARITGGGSTVDASQLYTDVLRNNLTYTLESGIQVRQGRVGREPVIQLIPPNRDIAQNLTRNLGVMYEKGAVPVYYIPNNDQGPAETRTRAILAKLLQAYPVKPEAPASLQSRNTTARAGADLPIHRLENTPEPANSESQTNEEIENYWAGAKFHPDIIEGVPVLWTNNSAFDLVARRLGHSGESAREVYGVPLDELQRHNIIAEAEFAAQHQNPEGFDRSLAALGNILRSLPDGPMVVMQSGPHVLDSQIQTALREELNHILQMGLPGGLRGLPVDLIDTKLGKRASRALAFRGYRMPDPKSPFYEHDRTVMAAEISVRLMEPGMYRELALTRHEAIDLAEQFLTRLLEDHGDDAEKVTEKIRETIQAIEASTGGQRRDQHAGGVEGSAPAGTRGPPQVLGESARGEAFGLASRRPEEVAPEYELLARPRLPNSPPEEDPDFLNHITAKYEALVKGAPGHIYINREAEKTMQLALGISKIRQNAFQGLTLGYQRVQALMHGLDALLSIAPSAAVHEGIQNLRTEIQRAMADLPVGKRYVTFAESEERTSPLTVRETRKEEEFHRQQLTRNQGDALVNHSDTELLRTDPATQEAWHDLELKTPELSPQERALEFGAILGTGRGRELGLSKRQAADAFQIYYNDVVARHGGDMEGLIHYVHPKIREILQETQRLPEGRKWPGRRTRVPERGPGPEPGGSDRDLEPGSNSGGLSRPRANASVPPLQTRPNGRGTAAPARSLPVLSNLNSWFTSKFGSDAPRVNYSGLGAFGRTFLPGRQFMEIEQASRPVFESALPAASSDAITSTILQSAIPAIKQALKHGTVYSTPSGIVVLHGDARPQAGWQRLPEYTWPDLQLYYIESRLRGLKQRWQDFADQARAMSDDDAEKAIQPLADGEKSPFLDLLSKIEGRKGLPLNLGQTAAAIAESKDWDTLKEFLAMSFEDAAERVAAALPPDRFDEITDAVRSNPQVKEADRLYGELIEQPMAESHAVNEGVFSDAIGPAGRYYPLVPLNKPQTPPPGRRLAYHKPQNAANKFATGLSEAYDPGMEALAKRLTLGNRGNYKAALIQTMRDEGWLVKESEAFHPPEGGLMMIGPDGIEYKAVREETQQARTLIQNGKVIHLPARFEVMPQFMNRGLKTTLQREPMNPDSVIRLMHWANMLATRGPLELAFHSAGVLGALYANTPFLGPSGLAKVLSLPVVKWFAIRQQLMGAVGGATSGALGGFIPGVIAGGPVGGAVGAAAGAAVGGALGYMQTGFTGINPTTPANVKKLQEMAKAGAIPAKSGKVTYSKEYAEMTGAKRERFSFSPMLYGPKGLDARARILMYDIFKASYPHGNATDLHHFVNQLANYTPEMQGPIETFLKKIGIGPFATAGMTRIVNSVNNWSGMGPQKGQTLQSKMFWWLMASAWIGLAAWIVAYKHLTGLFPWEDKRAQLFMLPVGGRADKLSHFRYSDTGKALWGNGPEVGQLNFAWLDNPLALRGARAMGIADAFKAHQLGANAGQISEAVEKGVLNSFAHPALGPATRAMFAGITGESPYVTSLRDRGRIGIQFYPAIPPATKPGLATNTAKSWAALKQLNSFYTEGAENLGDLTGFSQPRGPAKKGSWWWKEAGNVLTPGLIGNPSNPWKASNAIRQEQHYTSLPHYAKGGVILHPQKAVVGEAGPEAIVDLKEKDADSVSSLTTTPLSAEGIADAEKVGRQLKSRGGLDMLIPSGLVRAQQTAEVIANQLGIETSHPNDGLNTWCLGKLDGKTRREIEPALDEYVKQEPDTPLPGLTADTQQPGESFNQFRRRALNAIQDLLSLLKEHPDEKIGAATSSKVLRLVRAWDAKGSPTNMEISTAKYLAKNRIPFGEVWRLYYSPSGKLKLQPVSLAMKGKLEGGLYLIRHGNVAEPNQVQVVNKPTVMTLGKQPQAVVPLAS